MASKGLRCPFKLHSVLNNLWNAAEWWLNIFEKSSSSGQLAQLIMLLPSIYEVESKQRRPMGK